MKKCKCGRVYRYGDWVRPVGRDLADIVDAIYKQQIRFIDEVCDKCENRLTKPLTS